MSEKVLAKYAAVYGPQTQIVPFTFTCMLTGEQYAPYRRLHLSMREHGGPIHIHVLSGACHYILRFMTLFPEHRMRVVSQVYDSPCNIKGVVPTLSRMYHVPLPIGKAIAHTIFADCVESSSRWVEGSPFRTSIQSGYITSTRDAVAPVDAIAAMMRNWRNTDARTMITDSLHLESLKDHPQRYKSFCLDVVDRAEVDGWKVN